MNSPRISFTVDNWPGIETNPNPPEKWPCTLSFRTLDLDLRTAFGTSHSATTTRTNALVVLKVGCLTGLGEAGLPPKKPGCYEADVKDCTDFMEKIVNRFGDLDDSAAAHHDPFERVPALYVTFFPQCILVTSSPGTSTPSAAACRPSTNERGSTWTAR